MAFTAQEKADLLYYLGYSGFEDDGPEMKAINSLDARETTMGARIRALLGKLADVDRQIHASMPLAMAISDGAIQLRAHYSISALRSIGRQYTADLGRWLKVAVIDDVFSEGGRVRNAGSFYSGDPSEKRINPIEGVPTLGVD